MANRFYVQTMSYFGAGTETWAVWDRLNRHECTWTSRDRKAIASKAKAMNAALSVVGQDASVILVREQAGSSH